MTSPPRLLIAILAVMAAALVLAVVSRPGQTQPIRIGVLHSLSGAMATSEHPLVDAVRLAVEEINLDGGLPGWQVKSEVADGKSDGKVFAAETERLI